MSVNFLHVDRIFVSHQERERRANFYAHFFEGNSVFFPCCPPWTHDLIHVSDKKNFFTYHQTLSPTCSLLHQCVSVFAGPFHSVLSRFDVSCHLCIFYTISPASHFFHSLSLSPSRIRVSTSFFPFFAKEGARNEYARETAREIAPFLTE